MDDLENKLGALLSDPDLMNKIQTMAKSLGESAPSSSEQQKLPNIDISALQRLSGLASQSSIDANQQALLSALSPYLSRERIGKLENAMRAARMARLASVITGGVLPSLMTGR